MSNTESDSFINEVSEEVRKDRLFAYWKKYGPFAIGGIVLILAATAWFNYKRDAELEAARATGGKFVDIAQGEPTAEAYADLAAELPADSAVIARLHAASALEADDPAAATAAYKEIADDLEADTIYRNAARIAAARIGEGLDLDTRLSLLSPATEPGAPFRLLALETRGVLLIVSGDAEAGRADLQAVLDDPLASRGSIQRATELMLATGGTIE